MSDDSQTGEGQASGEGQQSQVTLEELKKQVETLQQTNARLLDESKKYKSKSKESMTELERIQQEILEKEGDAQKLLEAERKKAAQLAEDNKKIKAKTMKANMMATLSRYATDVYDLDDLVNQPKYFEILQKGLNEDTLELEEEAAKTYIKTVLEAKPWLKKATQVPGAITSRPGAVGVKPKSLGDMSATEIEEQLKKLF